MKIVCLQKVLPIEFRTERATVTASRIVSRNRAVYFSVLAHKPVIQPVTPGFVPGLTVKGFTFLMRPEAFLLQHPVGFVRG